MNYENYDPCFPDQPVVDLYLRTWANLPAFRLKDAFVWVDDSPARMGASPSMTYGELNSSVQCISSSLLQQLRRGDTVVILCEPGLELVEVIFACQRAGLKAVPTTPPHPSFASANHHHLARVLSQTKPKAAIAAKCYINRVKEYVSSNYSSSSNRFSQLLQMVEWIPLEDIKGKAHRKASNEQWDFARYSGCRADDVYLIQYTSGATGIPKPVLVTAGAAANNVRTARKAYDLHPNSVIVSWLPQLWLELISEYNATCTPVPSFTLPLVLKRGGVGEGSSRISLESLKNLIIINEPIYKALVDEFVDAVGQFGLKPSCISPSYGLAENCTFVSTAWRSGNDEMFPVYRSLLPSARLSSSVEEAEEIQIVVVNQETHELVNDGIEGEIWLSSPSNASGYLDHPSLTREVFNGRLKNINTAGCFVRTGDRGIVKGKERYLFVTGRCADIIKLENGQEIHPHYIETAAYNSCRNLIRGGCAAAFEVARQIVLVAEVQISEGESLFFKKISETIRKEVKNKENVELGLVVLAKCGSLPKTTSGKIQRWAAKNKLVEGGFKVVTKMEFGNNGDSSLLFKRMIRENEGIKEKDNMVEGQEEIMLATKPYRNHVSLLSSM
ncbi:disco-interacting protein 2B-A-like [Dorcoceras hygrometricum]|uniref:Disco-interacting protein 2B-A-like n=1 Tax=Dorcoceras hygrometricum TaxID=472368 RepID=A0A2Z7A9R1_9LAMI|nr:disco-interacting protein 2B-A-like [Dorcoceras hygrometricum]